MINSSINILVIEDNINDFYLIEALINTSNIHAKSIVNATTLHEAKAYLSSQSPDIIFLDLFLPDAVGLDAFKLLHTYINNIATIVLSGTSDVTTAIEAVSLGAQDYLVKGVFDTFILEKAIWYSIERKKVEKKSLHAEEKYRQLFYENPIPMLITDVKSNEIIEYNNAFCKEYAYEQHEVAGLTLFDIWETTNGKQVLDDVQNLTSNRIISHKKKNGEIIFVNINVCEIIQDNQAVRQILIRNVTKELQLQQQLNEEQKLKELQIIKAAVAAQEKERLQIGSELHDNINQILVVSLLYIEQLFKEDASNTLDILNLCRQNIKKAIIEIRALSRELIPPSFSEEIFTESLSEILNPIKSVEKINVKTDFDLQLNRLLMPDQKLTIFRIVQEQMNNIIKHAEAKNVDIALHTNNKNIILTIKDDGKGCSFTKLRKGVGLQNIVARANLYQGTTQFISEPNSGFKLAVTFKLN